MLLQNQHFHASQVKIPAEAFTYRYSTAGGPRFSLALATHVNEYFSPHTPINPEEILTAAGLTAMHEMIALALGDPGDGVLVSRPIYGRFELDFVNTAGLNIVYADTNAANTFDPEVVNQYQKALDASAVKGVKVKILMIVNPHNPLGT